MSRKRDSLFSTLRRRLTGRFVVNAFHRFWYDAPDTWRRNSYLGIPIYQLPLDMWLYQEVLYTTRPGFVIQTGVAGGGSILFFAHCLDTICADEGAKVVGIDVSLTPTARKLSHPRIHLIEGNSTAPETVERVKAVLPETDARGGLVSLDSDHSRDHVLREIGIFKQFVAVGSYLVVEDINVNGHPVAPRHGPGPFEAMQEFLRGDSGFIQDDDLWRGNLFSQHGWLRRQRVM